MIAWSPALEEGRRRLEGLPPLGEELPQTRGQLAREVPLLLVGAVVVAFLVKTFLAQLFFIPSVSMTPQLKVGDRVAVSKLAYQLHDPRRGDVVVFNAPFGGRPDRSSAPVKALRGVLRAVGLAQPSTEELIKRVIALPGETVEGRADGHVYVNGHVLFEPYLPPGLVEGRSFPPVRIPPGHLWMMGDNRSNSFDSRYFGPIAESRVVGRAVWRVWPPNRVAFL
ncbi:MAG: signal peptidase I [Acidimicrobiales bacterium]